MSLGDGRRKFFWIHRPYQWIIDFRATLAPAKFPNLHEDDTIPPPATRENPGQVYPKVNPSPTRSASHGSDKEKEFSPHRYHGNPHHFESGLKKLESALNDVIAMIEEEAVNLGPHVGKESDLLLKFKGWRRELSTVRTGAAERTEHRLDMSSGVPAELGGIFED